MTITHAIGTTHQRGRESLALQIAIVLALASACSGTDSVPADKSAPADTVSAATSTTLTFTPEQVAHGAVKWQAVIARTDVVTTEVPAQLVPNDDRTTRVAAPAMGRVVAVHVQPGDRIGVGQALVTLQSPEASAARADLLKANAELASHTGAARYAKSARDRAERLLAAKAAALQDVERARADDELAQSMLAQAKAEVDRAKATVAQMGATESGAMVLTSTTAGVVIDRDAVPGAVVSAGDLLITVSDASTLWLTISASEGAARAVRPGARITFSVVAFPGKTFDARVQSVGAALDSATRTVPIRALVENRNAMFRSATYATAWLPSGEATAGFSLPDDAVQLLDERPVVFVVRPDGKGGATFERRDVEVGAKSDGRTLITKGLSAGDVVVTEGAFAVKSEFARGKMAEG